MLGIVVLGVGLGMSLTMFALVNGVVWTSPNIEDGKELVCINWGGVNSSTTIGSRFGFREYKLLKNNKLKSFKWLAGYRPFQVAIKNPRGAVFTERYDGAHVTNSYFTNITAKPLLGRLLHEEDGLRGAKPVALLSYTVWQQHFMGLRDVIGKKVILNGISHTVVGVMPRGFKFPADTHVWAQFGSSASRTDVHNLVLFGELENNVPVAQAEQEIITILEPLAERHPELYRERHKVKIGSFNLSYIPLRMQIMFKALSICALLVFVVACANVSNLIMVRIAKRRDELLIRNIMGAGNYQIIQQTMLEGLMYSLAGTIIGYIIYALVSKTVWSIIEQSFFVVPYWWSMSLDWEVHVFAVFAMSLSTVISSLLPAIRSLRFRERPMLRNDIRTGSGLIVGKLSKPLITIQIICSTVLLGIALMMIFIVHYITDWKLPFNPRQILTTNVQLNLTAGFESASQINQFYNGVIKDIQVLPGVKSAGFSFHEGGIIHTKREFKIRGQSTELHEKEWNAATNIVSNSFFGVFDMQAVLGRLFLNSDTSTSEKVAIVNQYFVNTYFAGKNPLGSQIRVHKPGGKRQLQKNTAPWTDWMTIVGVVPNIQRRLLPGERADDFAKIYIPVQQRSGRGLWLLVKMGGNVIEVVNPIRQIIHDHAPLLAPKSPIQTLQSRFDKLNRSLNTLGEIIAVFGAVSLLMTVAGLYGLISFITLQQRREFGIRSALGAARSKVIWLVLQKILWQLLFGLVVGGAISIFSGYVLREKLAVLNIPFINASYVIGIGIVVAACFIAVSMPAFSATKVPPSEALRVS